MQLKPLVFTATLLAAALEGCGSADGPSLWSSGIATSGDGAGGSTTGDGTECGALAACCTELEEHPSSEGASCNGSSPSDETACAIVLATFQGTGSCTDIPNPDATTSTTGTTDGGFDGAATSSPDAAPAPVASYGCNQPQYAECQIIRTNGDAADACSLMMGTSSGTSCPTTDLVGCCVPPASASSVTTEDCYYSGGMTSYTTAEVMSSCASDGATFSPLP